MSNTISPYYSGSLIGSFNYSSGNYGSNYNSFDFWKIPNPNIGDNKFRINLLNPNPMFSNYE